MVTRKLQLFYIKRLEVNPSNTKLPKNWKTDVFCSKTPVAKAKRTSRKVRLDKKKMQLSTKNWQISDASVQ